MSRGLVLVTVGLLALNASAARPRTVVVHDARGFERAAAKLRRTGGTIVLRPGAYASLVIGPRSGPTLRVVGAGGVRVGRFVLSRTRRVSIGNVLIAPVYGDAVLELDDASNIDLHDLVV